METLVRILRDLGPGRVSAIGGIAVIAVLFLLFLTARLSTPLMSPLYSDLSEADSQEIVAYLSSQGVEHQLRRGGAEIMVATSVLAEIRLQLSALGLPRIATIGNELFDRDSTFDTASSFEQEVMRVRALEGEIARTIVSLEQVKSARVHVVLPRRELFDRQEREATASIVLQMRGSNRLDRSQILAVQHLVSTAVPGLKAKNISILDGRGDLLTAGGSGDGEFGGQSQEEIRLAYESRLAQQIERLLENAVGYGKARVQVAADMDFSKVIIQEEEYNPDGQVLRSTELIEEQDLLNQGGPAAVGVRGNLPDGAFGDETGGTQENRLRTEERSNYEVSRTTRNRVIEPGQVRGISVAALVDGNYRMADDGVEIYEPRDAEEMQQLEGLIKTAIGFSEVRSDTVSVVNMPFAPLPTDDIIELQTIFGFTTAQLSRLIEVLLLTLFGVLVIILLLRPLIARVFETTPHNLALAGAGGDEDSVQQQLSHQRGGVIRTSDGRHMVMRDGQLTEVSPDEAASIEAMIDIANVQGQVKAGNLKKMGELIQNDPEAAVSVIRSWLYVDAN